MHTALNRTQPSSQTHQGCGGLFRSLCHQPIVQSHQETRGGNPLMFEQNPALPPTSLTLQTNSKCVACQSFHPPIPASAFPNSGSVKCSNPVPFLAPYQTVRVSKIPDTS